MSQRSFSSLLLTAVLSFSVSIVACGDDTDSSSNGPGTSGPDSGGPDAGGPGTGGPDVGNPDATPPTVVITDDVDGTAEADVTFSFTFSEDVGESFTAEDVTVSGGTAGAFEIQSGTSATLVVAPPAESTGTIMVSVAAGSFEDSAGNPNTEASTADQAFDTTTAGGPFDGLVFGDDFGADVAFEAFNDSDNDLSVDMSEAQAGAASLRVAVPGGGFTGGALVLTPGVDVSGFDGLSFWVRSDSAKTLNVTGIGNDAADSPFNTEVTNLPVTSTWTQFTIPIPNPDVLSRQTGLFHFAEGSDEGAYTLWFDEIQYVNLAAGSISNIRPAIGSATEALTVDQTYAVGGASVILALDGNDVTLRPAAPAFFDYTSSDTAVATVDGFGVITGVGEGTATITATLDGVAASGTVTINVGMGCPADGANLTVNGDFETGDFSCMQQFVNGGTQTITDMNPSSGNFALNLNVVAMDNDTVVKFANLTPGDFTEGETVFISLDMRGAVTPGGVGFVELFSELEGGGTSAAVILFGGGPILPAADPAVWTNFSTTANVGPDTSGGISLQLKAASGAGTADLYFDNVCVSKDPCP